MTTKWLSPEFAHGVHFLQLKRPFTSHRPTHTHFNITSSLTPICFLQFTHKTMQVFLVSPMRPPPCSFKIQQKARLIFLISIANRFFFFRKILQGVSFIPIPITRTVTACQDCHAARGMSRRASPGRSTAAITFLPSATTTTTTVSNSARAHISHVHQRNPSLKCN
jgi:hypothetical protein